MRLLNNTFELDAATQTWLAIKLHEYFSFTQISFAKSQSHFLFEDAKACGITGAALDNLHSLAPDSLLNEHCQQMIELADAVIRILDLAGACGFDLGAAFEEKMAYNAERADHKAEARFAPGGKKV